jgi:predicted anti-sigma-YlaC factor YlaD
MFPFVYLYSTSHPAGGVQVLQKAWDILPDGVQTIIRTAESNVDALNTVDLGPKRPVSVGKCALCSRLSEQRFAAQVAAAVGLVEAPASDYKATAVAKEATAIKYGNTTGNSITKFLKAPVAGKHPMLRAGVQFSRGI